MADADIEQLADAAAPAGETEPDLAAGLAPAERMVMTIARAQIERGENPPINTTSVLLEAGERLSNVAERQQQEIQRLDAHCHGRDAALRILSQQYEELRAERGALAARIAAAERLHLKITVPPHSALAPDYCEFDQKDWPCGTVRALRRGSGEATE